MTKKKGLCQLIVNGQ